MNYLDKKDSLKTLPAIIALSAGLVMSIVMIVKKKDSLTSLIAVFAFLLGFYIVGLIFRAVLLAVATREMPEENKELENVETSDTEQTEDIKNN